SKGWSSWPPPASPAGTRGGPCSPTSSPAPAARWPTSTRWCGRPPVTPPPSSWSLFERPGSRFTRSATVLPPGGWSTRSTRPTPSPARCRMEPGLRPEGRPRMANAALDREIERYLARTPKSRALQAEAADVLPGGSSRGTAYFPPYPFFAQGGEGHYVYDVDGNRYLDFMLTATSLILGHAHPATVEALSAQAAQGTAFSTPTVSQIRLARILCDRIPSFDTVRFTNSGTEGTLMAIRAARAFTGRHRMAKFEGGYHGA